MRTLIPQSKRDGFKLNAMIESKFTWLKRIDRFRCLKRRSLVLSKKNHTSATLAKLDYHQSHPNLQKFPKNLQHLLIVTPILIPQINQIFLQRKLLDLDLEEMLILRFPTRTIKQL